MVREARKFPLFRLFRLCVPYIMSSHLSPRDVEREYNLMPEGGKSHLLAIEAFLDVLEFKFIPDYFLHEET